MPLWKMTPLYGYANVSTLDQGLAIQQGALKAAGRAVIPAEAASGTRREHKKTWGGLSISPSCNGWLS